MILTTSDLRWMDEQRRRAAQPLPGGDAPAAPRPGDAGAPPEHPADGGLLAAAGRSAPLA